MIVVSLHLPKTAGTSFLALLEAVYGDGLLQDYDDRPLHRTPWSRNLRAVLGAAARRFVGAPSQIACIHGHFLPLKYRGLAPRTDVRFATWLRDPVERLMSHYHYWKRSYDPATSGPLQRRVVDEAWDLERFCLGPELRNTYGRFLWGFPLQRFDFIGITEHYDDDLQAFSERFLEGAAKPVAPRNVNPDRDADEGAAGYGNDCRFRERVAAYHAGDVRLYRQALAMRATRRGH